MTHPLTCMRKRAYATERAAQSVIFAIRARNQDSERLQPYKCDVCTRWHIGALPPSLVMASPPAAA